MKVVCPSETSVNLRLHGVTSQAHDDIFYNHHEIRSITLQLALKQTLAYFSSLHRQLALDMFIPNITINAVRNS